MKPGDLTTLANVKAWLNTGSTAFPPSDDNLLARMITAASSFVLTWLSRDIVATDYTLTVNGDNTNKVFTPQYPIIAVSALSINGNVIPAATNPPIGSGFLWDKESIFNVGYPYPVGFQNVTFTYTAGYQSAESLTVPADNVFQIPVASLGRPWVTDRGVKFANGISLFKVAANPATGQYAVIEVDGVMKYQFADVNAGAAIVVTYGYCPADLEQALIEMIAERYMTRDRISQVSKSFGGEVISFSQKDFNANVADIFKQYRNVVPIL